MITLPLNLSQVVTLQAQYVDGGRYERDARHLVLTASTGSLMFGSADMAAGGTRKPIPAARVELWWSPEGVNGHKVGEYLVTDPTVGRASMPFTLTDEADGPGTLDLWGVNAAGARTLFSRFGAWIDRNGTAKDSPFVIVQNGNFSWVHPGPDAGVRGVPAEWAMVLKPKTSIAPRLQPLPKDRPILPVPTIDYRKLTRIAVVPGLSNDTPSNYRPVKTNRGIIVTDHIQLYFISQDMTAKWPRQPMVDGPRGKATLGMLTFLKPGRGWKRLWADSHALGFIDEEGTKHTIAGLRSKDQEFPRYWEHATRDDYDLVGVWPQDVPIDDRVIRECWAWRFYAPSLLLDLKAPEVGGEPPHVGIGPVSFAVGADGWVWKIQQNGGGPAALDVFGSKDRLAPAIVTRWFKTNGGWGLDVVGDEVIVTEREGGEMSAWSALTPNKKLRTILKNPNQAAFGKIVNRGWQATRSLAECRAQDFLGGEGLRWFAPPPGRPNSEGWLVWGSMAQQDVRRVRLDGTGLEYVGEPNFTLNSAFLTLDVSQYQADGTGEFGPPGTVFTTTWEINHFGRPQAFLPQAGKSKDGRPLSNGDWGLISTSPYPRDRAEISLSGNSYDVPDGAGGLWESDGYGSALGLGPGRLSYGSSSYGQHDIVASVPGEVQPDNAKMVAGAREWRIRHYDEEHGVNGNGFFAKDKPLPFGETPAIDYRLAQLGWKPEPVVVPPPPAPSVDRFIASTAQVPLGASVTLTWATTNATTVTISGLGDKAVDGTTSVVPAIGDSVYTLTAIGPGGTATASVTVNARALTIDERVAKLEAAVVALGGTL